MKKLQNLSWSEWASALIVVVTGWVVGRQAALGMEPQQQVWALFAVLLAIMLAVLVRWRPQTAEARAARRD